jgi:hydrogenase expression/formation protein HypC
MCLATPGLVVATQEQTAQVDFFGVTRSVRLDLLPDATVGDYVLVHAGFAIQRLDPAEARETIELLTEIEANSGHDSGERR